MIRAIRYSVETNDRHVSREGVGGVIPGIPDGDLLVEVMDERGLVSVRVALSGVERGDGTLAAVNRTIIALHTVAWHAAEADAAARREAAEAEAAERAEYERLRAKYGAAKDAERGAKT
jgi:hypothetical protein